MTSDDGPDGSAPELRQKLAAALEAGQQGFHYVDGELVCTTFHDGTVSAKAALDDVLAWLTEDAAEAMALFSQQPPVRAVLSYRSVHIEEDLATGRNPLHHLPTEWVLIRREWAEPHTTAPDE